MTFPTQPDFAFLDTLSGEGDCLAQRTAAQQQQMAAMAVDGRTSASPYFLGGHVLNGSMYGINPLVVESPQVPATLAAASTGGAVGMEGRRRSPTNSASGRAGMSIDHAQRRATHNAIERARRESLNGQFQDLASAVPSLIHVRRPSKATIVEKSLEYIRKFKEHMDERDRYIKKLQHRNMSLHNEVNRLRSQLGLEPLTEACDEAQERPDEEPTAAASTATEPMAGESDDAKKPVQKAGSPLTSAVSAASLHTTTVSAPAESRKQPLPLQKRRQSEQCAGRPALRVHTANIASKRAMTAAAAVAGSSDGSDSRSSNASASASPLLQASPLSAPLLTHAPQLPQQQQPSFAAARTSQQQQQQAAAAVAAAAFVARNNSQHSLQTMHMAPLAASPLTAAQLSAMGIGMSMTMGMSEPCLSSPLQVGGPMGGYFNAASAAHHPQMSAADMAKFSEAVFAASSTTAMPPMASAVDATSQHSLDPMSARMDMAVQFGGVSQ